jgi:hypothetical protein
MERRVRSGLRIWAPAAVFAGVIALSAGVAGGQPATTRANSAANASRSLQAATPASCVVHSLPSFVAQGELATAATVADVVEVECDPLLYGTGSEITVSAAQLFSRCGGLITWYVASPFGEVANTRDVKLTLDADGNATVSLIAGPGCQAGESLISAHMDNPPFESFTTSFSVLPPGETPEGVSALPAAQVEDAQTSAVATIVQAEFPGRAEQAIRVGSDEMLSRCRNAPHVHWIREDRTSVEGVSEVNGLALDNDGNAFVLLIGDSSCVPGGSLIEADLEEKPFTTLTTEFTILPPQPTAEPSLRIEKLQRIAGGELGFTTSPLSSTVGKTVEYEIVVENTANISEMISDFADPHCDEGTIAGGPGSNPLAPGQSTTFTCRHVLTAVGAYINQASATGSTAGGNPLTQISNEVEVTAAEPPHPAFTIEKQQMIAGGQGGFVTSPLTAVVGDTVDYQIVVTNTGDVALAMSDFTDSHCDPGTIAGGAASLAPSQQATYTCEHVLADVGKYLNKANVTGTPPGEAPLTHMSPQVEVIVGAAPVSSIAVTKLQRIGGVGEFTAAPLAALVGQTVEYEIGVSNTGSAPLTLSNFTDGHCDAGTIAGGPGASQVAPGSSTTFTCQHVLAATGPYSNVASLTAAASGQEPIELKSPSVEVMVQSPGAKSGVLPEKTAAPPRCTASPKLRGVGGPKRRPFTVHVSSAGVKQVTFYLDGHRLRTMRQAQAKGGQFSVRINPGKLSHGAHRVSFKTTMLNPACATTASVRTFVRPYTARVAPLFTG